MKLTKQQIWAVMILNVVLLILIAGVAVLFMTGNLKSANADIPKKHMLVRDARLSASNVFSWENNLGGTKDEDVKGFYILNDKLYVFGNTSSSDLDFSDLKAEEDKLKSSELTRGFLAVLSESGKTLSFSMFDGEIVKTMQLGNKFFVGVSALETKKAKILLLAEDGVVEKEHTIVSTGDETFIDLKFFSNKIHAVSSVLDKAINVKKLRVSVFSLELEPISSLLLARTFSLSYLTILPSNNSFLLAANVESSVANYLTLAQYTESGNILFTNVTLPDDFVTLDFAPFQTGYFALISYKDGTDILQLNKNLERKSLLYLNEPKSNFGKLILDGKTMSVFLNHSADSSVFLSYTLDLENKTTVKEFSNFDALFFYYFTSRSSLFVGSSATSLSVVCKTETETKIKSVGNGNEQNSALIPYKNGVLVATSATKSKDFAVNFGSRDIVVFFIPNI